MVVFGIYLGSIHGQVDELGRRLLFAPLYPACSPTPTFATEQTCLQLIEKAGLHALLPLRHETLEYLMELLL